MFGSTVNYPTTLGNTALVDAVYGSDSTGIPERPDKPFATPTAAIAAAGWGSVGLIQMGPGTFNVGTNNLRLPAGVGLRGAGRVLTTIVSTLNGASGSVPAAINPATGCEVSDFTLQCPLNPGTFCSPIGCIASAGDSYATNVVLRNLLVQAWSDGLFFDNLNQLFGSCEYKLYNCDFESNYDCTQATPPNSPAVSSLTVEAYGCKFASTYDGSSTNRNSALVGGAGTWRLYGCELLATGGANSAFSAGVYVNGNAHNQMIVELNGCRILGSGAPNNYSLSSGSNSLIKVGAGNSFDPSMIAGSGSVTGAVWSSVIGLGSSITQTTLNPKDSTAGNRPPGVFGQIIYSSTSAGSGAGFYICTSSAAPTWELISAS